ncbi:hypothetical protein DY000_02032424 [Brassica cretica]|uniref:Uncharacterized protein n=1 Tax=Brassica cretica TaxID=69181 RepID=A0ABQ7DL68_BRACR|nr:hypothetical protein DY000_02032424 [Brassica cretica]
MAASSTFSSSDSEANHGTTDSSESQPAAAGERNKVFISWRLLQFSAAPPLLRTSFHYRDSPLALLPPLSSTPSLIHRWVSRELRWIHARSCVSRAKAASNNRRISHSPTKSE